MILDLCLHHIHQRFYCTHWVSSDSHLSSVSRLSFDTFGTLQAINMFNKQKSVLRLVKSRIDLK